MQVTNINQGSTTAVNIAAYQKSESRTIDKNKEVKDKVSTEPLPPFSSWQKDILLDVIGMLENNMQVENSHPLSKAEAKPIDTFEEAILELANVNSEQFAQDASQAQANLDPQSVLELFLE